VLDEYLSLFGSMSPELKAQTAKVIIEGTEKLKRFVPLPGAQTEAYLSKADVLLYGGQAGGGKSYLLMGLASQEHHRSTGMSSLVQPGMMTTSPIMPPLALDSPYLLVLQPRPLAQSQRLAAPVVAAFVSAQ